MGNLFFRVMKLGIYNLGSIEKNRILIAYYLRFDTSLSFDCFLSFRKTQRSYSVINENYFYRIENFLNIKYNLMIKFLKLN